MQKLMAVLMFGGAVAAATLVAPAGANAQSVGECRAACNARYNPIDVPKEDRWRVDSRRRACLARCRR